MSVKIGHARFSETGGKYGNAGDSTGNEVSITNWYSKPWKAVFRAKDDKVAEKMAIAMEQACANDKIGYSQSDRTTCYTYAKAAGWNLSKITVKCNCDCSSLIAVCVNAAGIVVSKDMYTGNERQVLKASGAFDILTDNKYLTSDDYLKRGDILLGTGHTAIVLSNGTKIEIKPTTSQTTASSKKATKTASSMDKTLAGSYEVQTALNLRNGAGSSNYVMAVLPKGTIVKNYGYYSMCNGVKWLYVQVSIGAVEYTGFCSSKYLKKK